MDRAPEWLTRKAFGSAYGKDKVSKLKKVFELDERLPDIVQQSLTCVHVPRSYIDKEFPEYKSLFDTFEKYYLKQMFMVGSTAEGASSCRLLKYPECVIETDMLCVIVKLAEEKCSKLGRHSGQPGWYWLEKSISEAVIGQKKVLLKGRRPFYSIFLSLQRMCPS